MAKKNNKLASKDITNGAFIILIVVCMVISGIVGFVIGSIH